MTAVVSRAERDAFVAQAHQRAVRKVARVLTNGAALVGLAYWVVYGIVVVAVPLIVHAAGGVMGGGVMTGAQYSARWFAFSLALILFLTIMTTHVGAGGTRRALHVGVVAAAGVTGIVYGVMHSLALLGERAMFGSLGWPWESPDIDPTGSGFALNVVAQALVVAVYCLVAVAVVAGYQAFGVWRGTVLLLLDLVLLALVEGTVGSGAGGDLVRAVLPGDSGLPVAAGLFGGVVVLVVAAAWLRLLLLTMRLRPAR